MARCAGRLCRVALGAWSLTQLADRRRARHHQQSGADQHVAPRCRRSKSKSRSRFRSRPRWPASRAWKARARFRATAFPRSRRSSREQTDIYFARQQVNERLLEAPEPAARRRAQHGADLHRPRRSLHVDGRLCARPSRTASPAGSATALSHARRRTAATEVERGAYLRTVQDWIIRPQIKSVPGVAGVDAIGGYVKQYQVQPDPAKLIALGLSFGDVVKAIEANNVSRGASIIERNGEGMWCAPAAGSKRSRISARSSSARAARCRSAFATSPTWRSAARSEPAAPARTATRSSSAPRLMLIGSNSRTVAAAVDAKLDRISAVRCPPGSRSRPCSTARSSSTPPSTRCHEPRRRRAAGHRRAVPAARQFPRGADHGAGHSARDADDGHRAWCRAGSAPT